MPTFHDDLVFQVDFNNFDEDGKYLKGSMYHATVSRRIPRRGERVFLMDGEGNRCWASVHDVKGVKLLFELDETTWVSGELDVLAAPSPKVVGTLTVTQ